MATTRRCFCLFVYLFVFFFRGNPSWLQPSAVHVAVVWIFTGAWLEVHVGEVGAGVTVGTGPQLHLARVLAHRHVLGTSTTTTTSAMPSYCRNNNNVSLTIVLPQQQRPQPYLCIATTTMSALPSYCHYNDVCLTIVVPQQRCQPYHRIATTTMSAIPS